MFISDFFISLFVNLFVSLYLCFYLHIFSCWFIFLSLNLLFSFFTCFLICFNLFTTNFRSAPRNFSFSSTRSSTKNCSWVSNKKSFLQNATTRTSPWTRSLSASRAAFSSQLNGNGTSARISNFRSQRKWPRKRSSFLRSVRRPKYSPKIASISFFKDSRIFPKSTSISGLRRKKIWHCFWIIISPSPSSQISLFYKNRKGIFGYKTMLIHSVKSLIIPFLCK